MPKTRRPYPPEFREQMVALVRAGRTPEELSREFERSAQSIINWVAQADRDEGKRKDGLTSAEREELRRLRKANRQLRLASCPPWARPETRTTTRWRRVSLLRWSVKSSTADASGAGPRRAWRSSAGWKAGTIRTGATRLSVTCHRSITRGRCYQELLRAQALNRPRKRGKTTSCRQRLPCI